MTMHAHAEVVKEVNVVKHAELMAYRRNVAPGLADTSTYRQLAEITHSTDRASPESAA